MVLVFVLVAATLQWAWSSARGTAAEKLVIDQLTVKSAVGLIDLLTPEVSAYAAGASIKAPGGGLNVLNGCEGTDVLILLLAALASYPLGWRARLLGLLAGGGFVFAANQLRLLALFYTYRHDRELFSQLHGLVLPLLLVAATLAFFVWLLGWNSRQAAAQAPTA